MKKICLLLLTIAIASTLHAQFTKGDRYITGTAGLGFNQADLSNGDSKSIAVNLSPAIMKFKTDRRAMGFNLNLQLAHQKYNPNPGTLNDDRQYTVGAGIFKLNVLPLGKGLFLSAQHGLQAGYTWGKTVSTSIPFQTEIKNSGYNIGAYITPALGYKLSDRIIVGVNFSNLLYLNFNHTKIKYTATYSEERSGISFGSAINNNSIGQLGIQFGFKLK